MDTNNTITKVRYLDLRAEHSTAPEISDCVYIDGLLEDCFDLEELENYVRFFQKLINLVKGIPDEVEK